MGRDRFWPGLLLAIAVFFAGLLVWSAHQAATRVSPISDPTYYRRGLRHEETMGEERAARQQGWRLRASIGDGELRVRLEDAQGNPVAGAKAEFTFAAAGADSSPLRLVERASGEYAAALPRLDGPVSGRLEVRRGPARLLRSLLLHP